MIVNYQLVGGSGWTLLFNEANGDANEKFAPSFHDTVYKVAGYGAANQKRIPQSNTEGQLPLKWSSNYASPAAATAAIKALRATFKGVAVNLQVIVDTTTVYFNNATLAGSAHDQHGKECAHQLTFDTDDIS